MLLLMLVSNLLLIPNAISRMREIAPPRGFWFVIEGLILVFNLMAQLKQFSTLPVAALMLIAAFAPSGIGVKTGKPAAV